MKTRSVFFQIGVSINKKIHPFWHRGVNSAQYVIEPKKVERSDIKHSRPRRIGLRKHFSSSLFHSYSDVPYSFRVCFRLLSKISTPPSSEECIYIKLVSIFASLEKKDASHGCFRPYGQR